MAFVVHTLKKLLKQWSQDVREGKARSRQQVPEARTPDGRVGRGEYGMKYRVGQETKWFSSCSWGPATRVIFHFLCKDEKELFLLVTWFAMFCTCFPPFLIVRCEKNTYFMITFQKLWRLINGLYILNY